MFGRLTLRHKLTLGFVSVLVLLSAVAGIGFVAMSNSTKGFGTYRVLARDTNLSGRVQANMLMVRMMAKDYLITGSDKHKKKFAEYWEKMQAFMQESRSEIKEPERADIIEEIDNKLIDYEKSFEKVEALVDRRNEQVNGVLHVVGPQMEQNLTKILLAAKENDNTAAFYKVSLATRNLLLARIHVFKFLESKQPAAIEQVNRELAELDKNLATLDGILQSSTSTSLLQEVRKQKSAYARSFAETARLIQARENIVQNQLNHIGPDVATEIENLKLAIKAEQDNLGPELQAQNRRAQTLVVVISLIALVLGVGMAAIMTRSIVGPMKKSCAMIEELEKGHLDRRLNFCGQDEIGQMTRTMDRFAESLQHEIVHPLQKLAEGDLVFHVAPKDEQDLIRGALRKLRRDLNSLVIEIQNAGDQIASGSSQISDGAQSLSQGANESAASVEQISAAMNQLASQTKQNAENAAQANQLVNRAKAAAEKGNEQMKSMVSAMFEINEDGRNISKIIKVIDEIAFQTNLLALNAAVEAARAGQHGKGFAVVAEEVRNLAARSAKAARETAELIEGSVHKTQNGTQIANQTEAALKEIVSGVIKTADLVSEIAVASDEQSRGISQIHQGLNQIDLVTQQNTANAEESAAAAEELSSQAEELRRMLSRFKADAAQTPNPPKASNKNRSIKHLPSLPPAPMADEDLTPPEINPSEVIALSDEEFGKG